MKYQPKADVPQAIVQPYRATVGDTDSDSDDEEVEHQNEFTRETMWRDRNRGLSLDNKRGCDEIMRQFLEFEDSMCSI